MVKINFSDITIYSNIEKTMCVRKDLRKEVANDMYQYGQGVAFHALALKIYNGQDEQEFDEEEYGLIMDYARQMCTPMIIDAFEAFGLQAQLNKQ